MGVSAVGSFHENDTPAIRQRSGGGALYDHEYAKQDIGTSHPE